MTEKKKLEEAKRLYQTANADQRYVLESLFPELQESEDERIRKELIDYINRLTVTPNNIDRYNSWITWLEKQGEQKSADKVEPKFHEGDWIVNNNSGGICQVTEIRDDEYCLWPLDAEIMGYLRIIDVNNEYHLWNIQDVKEGDVVVDKSDGTIGIFQNIGHHPDGGSFNDPSYCFLHCRYDDGYFYADFEDGNIMDSYDVIPATKEQRDILFQEMKETGYEWNADTKELKRIEQPSAWCEEDEHRAKDTIYFLDTAKKHYASTVELDACIDWLESLKQKMEG